VSAILAGAILFAATATASVRSPRVEVGDPVSITVKVVARPGALISLRTPDSHEPAFTVDAGGQRVVQADADGVAVFHYEVTAWGAGGETSIPPARVEIAGIGTVETNAVTIAPFNPLGAAAKDQAPKDIRDIKPFPVRFPDWAWIALGAMMGIGAWMVLRPRKKKEARAPVAPVALAPAQPSLLDAIDAVRRIADHPPRDRAGIRDAHFVVAEAVRRYVEERWEVPASRQTTEEFLAEVASRGTAGGRVLEPRDGAAMRVPHASAGLGGPRIGIGLEMLPVVLEACDRVKWAGDSVGPDDTVQLAKTALEFFAASRGSMRGLGAP
jgi:hypothetical protein